jgi:hypothetical protein
MQRSHISHAFVRGYLVVATTAAFLLALGAFVSGPRRARFSEIDVGRINIVEPDGKVRMVISNREAAPGWTFHGRPVPGRSKNAGMIFFNDEGEENGGFIYRGQRDSAGVEAGMSLTFDQYEQDQVVALQYSDDNGRMRQGLAINEFPRQPTLADVVLPRLMPEGPARDAARARVDSLMRQSGGYGHNRAYFGRDTDRNAIVRLADPRGRTRLRMLVDSLGLARIEFLDTTGAVVRTVSGAP